MNEHEYRTESDTMGEVVIAAGRLWGAQTQRSFQNFPIGTERMPLPIIRALAMIKKAAALANRRLGVLDKTLADAIVAAADDVLGGALDDQFPLPPWQTGSGTHSNMNMNEVLANRANQYLGQPLGSKSPVHPNDHVNRSQSSNDTFPTAMHVAFAEELSHRLLPVLDDFVVLLRRKQGQFDAIVKIGRTHLQDATPMTLGQEVGAWASQIEGAARRIRIALPDVMQLAQGGTAVGTGLNAPRGFDVTFCEELARLSGMGFEPVSDKFAALAGHDALVAASGTINALATALLKVAGDVRLLVSGPRCGLAEIIIPSNEPGSSIMPGKVNPSQAEALSMVCCQVMGNHLTTTLAGSRGELQLNVFKPVLIVPLLQSVRLLADACRSFMERCLDGLHPDTRRIEDSVNRSLMLVTALAPHIGYDRAAAIAKKAYADGTTLKQAAKDLKLVSESDFDAWVRPGEMLGPT